MTWLFIIQFLLFNFEAIADPFTTLVLPVKSGNVCQLQLLLQKIYQKTKEELLKGNKNVIEGKRSPR